MFSAIRRYTVKQGTVEELIRRVQEGFVPIVRNMPGFRGCYLVNGGPEVLIAISVFDNAHGALASNEYAADWVRQERFGFRLQGGQRLLWVTWLFPRRSSHLGFWERATDRSRDPVS